MNSERLRLKRDRVAGAVLMLFALGVMWETRAFPLGSIREPGPGYMPMLLAITLAAMAILVIVGGGASPWLSSIGWAEKKHALAILAGCAFTAVSLERIGYRLTVMILLGFLLWVVERKRPSVVVLTALGLSLGTFFLFSSLLRVPHPLGPRGF